MAAYDPLTNTGTDFGTGSDSSAPSSGFSFSSLLGDATTLTNDATGVMKALNSQAAAPAAKPAITASSSKMIYIIGGAVVLLVVVLLFMRRR